MASKKLTNSDREEILGKVMTFKFKSKLEELITKQAVFASKIYDDVFTDKERKIMESLPDGWMETQTHVKVRFGAENYSNLEFNGRYNSVYFAFVNVDKIESVSKRIPTIFKYNTSKIYEALDPLAEEYTAICNEVNSLKDVINKTYYSTRAALQSITTVSKLVKTWVEIKPFIPSYCFDEYEIQLPAIKVNQLNEMLGLPVPA